MWTIAIVLAAIALAAMFVFLAKSFAKEYIGIKTLLIMAGLGVAVITSRLMGIIIEEKATGSMKTGLASMATSTLIVTITLFSFFVAYFLIVYTRQYFITLREVRRQRVEE